MNCEFQESGRLNIGVIGVGYMGELHVKILSELPEVEKIFIYDIDRERATEIANMYPAIPVNTLDELIDNVDAVSIATPTPSHFELAEYVISQGKHLLLEKPMTDNIELAERLIRSARERNLVLQIGHIERYNPAVRQLLSIVRAPKYIRVSRLGPPTLRNISSGVILELMIHDLDIILKLVGDQELLEYRAYGSRIYSDKEDIAFVFLRYPNTLIELTVSRVYPEKYRQLYLIEEDESKLKVYLLDFVDQSLREIVYSLTEPFELISSEQIEVNKSNPLRNELEGFIKAVINGERPVVTGEDGLRALKLAMTLSRELIYV